MTELTPAEESSNVDEDSFVVSQGCDSSICLSFVYALSIYVNKHKEYQPPVGLKGIYHYRIYLLICFRAYSQMEELQGATRNSRRQTLNVAYDLAARLDFGSTFVRGKNQIVLTPYLDGFQPSGSLAF